MKILATNKLALYNYFILDTFEAGIALEGSEVKSIRNGNADLKEAFVLITRNDELVIKNMFVKSYDKSSSFKPNERRDRKLLMHTSEIRKLKDKVQKKGLTIIPTKVYINGKYVKVEIALAQGKHNYDKKQVLKEKDKLKEMQREIKNHN